MNNPAEYINYSGGANGADMTWDKIGREFGVTKHAHWRPHDLKDLSPEDQVLSMKAVISAAEVLKRPSSFKDTELVQRNWLQVVNAEAIYAISRIIEPGGFDKGFINKSGKQVVSGGTGWAVEMAIQIGKPVAVFDMNTNKWYWWVSAESKFKLSTDTVILTRLFAGISSRFISLDGIKAIRDVYTATFPS